MTVSARPVPSPPVRAERALDVTVSVVVPVTDRVDDLAEMYQAHAAVLRRLGHTFEFIFVIDGGFEATIAAITPLQVLGEPVRLVTLPRAYGEATALMMGFEHARGDVLVTLPPYQQTTPDGLEMVLGALDGHDLVVARRATEFDGWLNRVQRCVFHGLLRFSTGTPFRDISCGLKAMRRQVAREIEVYGDQHRFFPLFAYQRGFRVKELDVPQHPSDRRPRLRRPGLYLRRMLDILTMAFLFKFTRKPLRFFGLVGAALFGAGLVIAVVLVLQKVVGTTALSDRPLLILGLVLMVFGVQVGSTGLLGELIVFTHARDTKEYAIDEILEASARVPSTSGLGAIEGVNGGE